MNDFPFGFSRPGPEGGDGDGENGREGNSGQPFDPNQPFDPSQLGNLFTQLGQMFNGMGGGMGGVGNPGASNGDAVNYELATSLARQQIGKHSPVSAGQRTAITEAVHLAELWLDETTALPAGTSTVVAWTPVDWLEKTLPTWKRLCNPVAAKASGAWSTNLPEEAKAFAGPMMGMFSQVGAMAFGTQLGQGLGHLAAEVLTSTDIGVPLAPEGTLALLPAAIEKFSEGLEEKDQEILVFLAAREAAHQRLFAHVPWLRQRLLASVEEYASGIEIDMSGIEELGQAIDPTALTDPQRLEEIMAQHASALEPKISAVQTAALQRLETLLALIEGWVETVVHATISPRLPSADALRETMRRRRASGGPAEQTFATLVGLELRPRRVREAAELWSRLEAAVGIDQRDGVWAHPDLLPNGDDLDSPAGFIDRVVGGDTDDDPIAELNKVLAAEADAAEQELSAKPENPTTPDGPEDPDSPAGKS